MHLRKRSPRHTLESAKRLPQHNNGVEDKKGRRRGYPPIALAAVTLLAIAILHRSYRYFVPATIHVPNDEAKILPALETLSNVPLGFSLDLPAHAGATEVYLDSRLIAATTATDDDDADDDTDDPASSTQAFKVGTCDIGDHGENVLKHSFSLGEGELENMRSILLTPGAHEISIERRKGNTLTTYARMEVTVHSPPELEVPASFFSGSPYVAAYNLAIKEMGNNIACNHFVAGTGWSQLWTRDTSFAAELGAALVHPSVVKQSLMASVEKDGGNWVWLQDKCGHFGGWPNLSDAIVGVRGAWSLYLVTGDKEMLSWAYGVTKNSLARAEREVYEHHSGLFKGCSSFLESNSGYPDKYENDGERVGKTKALSTNMLYYAGYHLGSMMGRELGGDAQTIQELEEKAVRLKKAIRQRLSLGSK